MDSFDKEFVTELFLDTDSVSIMNRLVVAVANVVNENSENVSLMTDILKKEHSSAIEVVEDETESPGNSPLPCKRRKLFYEQTVLNYTDEEYLERFKMRRSTVHMMINFLQKHMKLGTTIVSLDKKVHVFIYLLTSDASYADIGALFEMHKSSVAYVIHEIASLLSEQRYNFINWPSVEEQHITRIKVNSRFKFPNCVGFIDVCRLTVGSKRNKKRKPETVQLQAVCDESLQFIDVYISDSGHIKKNKLFKESPLSKELKNFIDFENHILGSSDYKLKNNLIVPFSTEEVLTNEEMKFNEIHWKARSYIGHAFELLKERFSKLSHIDINKPDYINTLIYAACVLHNFVLTHEGCPEVKDEPITCDDGVTIDTTIVQTPEEKRQFLSNYINYIDST